MKVALNVTKGSARALFVKHGSCPRYPDDVQGGVCTGDCLVRWYTVYEEYDGKAISHSRDVAQIGNGEWQ